MVAAPAVALPVPPIRGGGRAGRGYPRGGVQVRFYAFSCRMEAVTSNAVITCMVLVCRRDASILFYPGSTYSYVSSYFALYLDISHDSLSSPFYVSMPIGDSIIVDRVYHSCLVVIGGFDTRVDLLLLSMVDFDAILGMDRLLPYHAILDCHAKTITLAMPGLPRLEWRGTLDYVPIAFVRDVSVDTPTVESIPVVRDFPDVFPADLPSMPPDSDIDFGIDLLPGTQPISIPPYRIAPVKLNELKE
ncbi:uncharacterized protein [Nicotiana tomentosiformis]|uniref:uncharacterized protein n=1 Tax=Nicotiana tomentosiformis TaxID=4098 RepID=UPI00388CB2F5